MNRFEAIWMIFWEEIMTPSSREETWYDWAVIALAHTVVGALIVSALGIIITPVIAWICAVSAYILLKEVPDRKAGGSLSDSVIDTSFFVMGVFYSGPLWWPFAVVALTAVGVAWKISRIVNN